MNCHPIPIPRRAGFWRCDACGYTNRTAIDRPFKKRCEKTITKPMQRTPEEVAHLFNTFCVPCEFLKGNPQPKSARCRFQGCACVPLAKRLESKFFACPKQKFSRDAAIDAVLKGKKI